MKDAVVKWESSKAAVTYDGALCGKEDFIRAIESLDYRVVTKERIVKKILLSVFYLALIAVIFVVLQKTGVMNILAPTTIADSSMGYALLFVTGLLTSVHCISMCGGINLSQSLPKEKSYGKKYSLSDFKPSLLYNAVRVTCYTLIGLVLGTVSYFLGAKNSSGGAAIPYSAQGILKIIAGVVMCLMGLSLLDLFPFVRKIIPHLPSSLVGKISSLQKKGGPFIVGVLNGFMPCGPMQAMWLVAFASGSPLGGALSMLFFSLGTVPLMLGLGSVIALLGKKYSEVVMKIGAVLVAVMGLSMVSQGYALSKVPVQKVSDKGGIVLQDGKQIVKSKLSPYRYPTITVKKGVPVHWEIEAERGSLTGCNYRVIFPDLEIFYELHYGTNIIEFTPQKSGTMNYTCWMGMVNGEIKVTD